MQNQNNTTEQNTPVSRVEKRQQRYDTAMENFNQKQIPQSVPNKKRSWITTIVIIVAITIGVILIIEMSSQLGEEQKSFVEVFSMVSATNATIAIGALLGVILLDIAKFVIILHTTTNQLHPLISAKTALMGRYYDNITPFASGGQPMQIYYLCKKGFNGGLSSAVVMIKYFFNTTAWLLMALVCMACNTKVLVGVPNGEIILIAGWIGWGINVCLPAFLITFVAMPKLARKLTAGVVHIGYKLKIVKDEQKVLARAESVVQDFRSAFIIMSKRPFHMIMLTLVCVVEVALSFAFPYFIIRMFNGFAADEGLATMFAVMGLNVYAAFAASVVPTPGNSGAMELIITVAFSTIAGATLLWVIFTWRFAVFYIYIIIGLVISVFNLIRNLASARKAKAAPAETPAPADERIVEVVADPDSSDETTK